MHTLSPYSILTNGHLATPIRVATPPSDLKDRRNAYHMVLGKFGDGRMEDGFTEEQERTMREDFIHWANKNAIVISMKEQSYEVLHEFLIRRLKAAG